MRLFRVCVLALSLFSGPFVAPALAATVAVGVDLTRLDRPPAGLADGIARQAAEGVKNSIPDLAFAPNPAAASALAACADWSCVEGAAARAAVDYAIRVEVRLNRPSKPDAPPKGKGSDYAVTVIITRTDPPGLWQRGDHCGNCELDETKHLAYLIASQLAEEIPRENAVHAAAPPANDPVPAPVAPPAVAASSTPDAAAAPAWLPWTLAGGAVVLAGGGVAALVSNHRGTCDLGPGAEQCPNRLNTGWLGYTLIGAGVVSLGGAIWAFSAQRPREQGTLSWSTDGNSVFLSGQF